MKQIDRPIKILFWVYILLSLRDNRFYIGLTKNIDRRLKEHNSGKVISTKERSPLFLIYCEACENKIEAIKRENFLKSLWSGRFKKKLRQSIKQNFDLGPP